MQLGTNSDLKLRLSRLQSDLASFAGLYNLAGFTVKNALTT